MTWEDAWNPWFQEGSIKISDKSKYNMGVRDNHCTHKLQYAIFDRYKLIAARGDDESFPKPLATYDNLDDAHTAWLLLGEKLR